MVFAHHVLRPWTSQSGWRPSHVRLLLALAGVLAVTSLALAACGGGSNAAAAGTGNTKTTTTNTKTTTTQTSAGSSFTTAFRAYSSCMAAHGVKLSLPTGSHQAFRRFTPGSPPSTTHSNTKRTPGFFAGHPPLPKGVTEAKYEAAQKACQSKLPSRGSFGSFGSFGGGSPASSEAFDAYRNCLKVNGVTLPSRPSASNRTPKSTPPTTSAASRAKFEAAAKACANLLPARHGSSTSPTTAKGS